MSDNEYMRPGELWCARTDSTLFQTFGMITMIVLYASCPQTEDDSVSQEIISFERHFADGYKHFMLWGLGFVVLKNWRRL